MKVKGKVIVVTGGGNGIGRELVLHLLAKGASVAAVDINSSAVDETLDCAGECDGRLSTHIVDITNKALVDQLPEQVIARHGAVDGLINNAGIIQPFVRIHALEEVAIDRVMDVNFNGTLNMVRAFLPHLLRRPEAHLMNVSSMGGFLPVPGQSMYGAAKASVKLLTEGLHSELLMTPVRVTVVFPGAIGTNITENSGVELEMTSSVGKMAKLLKPLPPAKAARLMVKGMERNRYRVLVGSDAVFMDLLYRISPKGASRLISRLMQSLLAE